jgi:hypothetical protein
MDELLRRLGDGVDQLTSSDDWLRYLDVQRRFHHYSFGNCILIARQRPDPTQVAGFRRWLELGRHVRKGEKGIAILAPIVKRLKVEDEEGEKHTIVSAPRAFRVVYVFDIAQTDGDELPALPVHKLEGGDPDQVYARLRAVASGSGFTVEEDYLDGPNGDWNHELRRIRVEARNQPLQQVKTLAHELAHASPAKASPASRQSSKLSLLRTSSAPTSASTARRTPSDASRPGPTAVGRCIGPFPSRVSASRRPRTRFSRPWSPRYLRLRAGGVAAAPRRRSSTVYDPA